jgi:hypothetical protein
MWNDYDAPEDLFEGRNAEETRDNHLTYLGRIVLVEVVSQFEHAVREEERQHLQGCAQRFQMMDRARIEIGEASESPKGPISNDKLTHLNMCLNSYYVNLRGALDNLAWAALYRFGLRPEIDETDRSTQWFCTFAGKDFRKSLAVVKPFTETVVEGIQTWLKDLATFRDPAAHRLPLAMAPALLTYEEGEIYKGLLTGAWAAAKTLDFEMYDKLMGEANALGVFRPFLNTPRAQDGGIYIVPNLIAADHRRFLDFSHAYLPIFTGDRTDS